MSVQRLGRTHVFPLCSILFIIYIHDIYEFVKNEEYVEELFDQIENASFSLTAEDVIIHACTGESMQYSVYIRVRPRT